MFVTVFRDCNTGQAGAIIKRQLADVGDGTGDRVCVIGQPFRVFEQGVFGLVKQDPIWLLKNPSAVFTEMFVRLVQPPNAPDTTLLTFWGMVTLVRLVLPANASPMMVTVKPPTWLGITTTPPAPL